MRGFINPLACNPFLLMLENACFRLRALCIGKVMQYEWVVRGRGRGDVVEGGYYMGVGMLTWMTHFLCLKTLDFDRAARKMRRERITELKWTSCQWRGLWEGGEEEKMRMWLCIRPCQMHTYISIRWSAHPVWSRRVARGHTYIYRHGTRKSAISVSWTVQKLLLPKHHISEVHMMIYLPWTCMERGKRSSFSAHYVQLKIHSFFAFFQWLTTQENFSSQEILHKNQQNQE